jgi:hypothetical protein
MFKEKAGVRACYQKGLTLLNSEDKLYRKPGNILDEFELDPALQNDLAAIDKKKRRSGMQHQIISQSDMTDTEFNMLIVKVSKCRTATKKAEVIMETISSAGDFLDILGSQCLFDDEYLVLFDKLLKKSIETIAFLVKTAANSPYDFDIQDMEAFANKAEQIGQTEDEWQKYLALFISELPENDQKAIADIGKNLTDKP